MPHPDLDAVLNALLPFARRMLAKRRELFPFGACMTSDGTIEMVAGQPPSELPSSHAVIDHIAETLRRRAAAGEIRAAGICYDVTFRPSATSPPTDAVCASLDHSSGEHLNVILPYRRRRFRGPKYGDLLAAPGSIRVFARGG